MTMAWIKAYFLRMIKRPAMIFALAFVLVATLLLTLAAKSDMSGMKCGVLACDDESASEIITKLSEQSGILDFEVYDDEGEMVRLLKRGELRFAYVFDSEFTDKYISGEIRHTVKRFSKEADIFAALADEVVFSKIADVCANIEISAFSDESEFAENAINKYNEYMDLLGNIFVYETLQGQVVSADEGSAAFPVRGFAAALVLVCALYGMQTVMSDEEKGLLLRLSPKARNCVRVLATLIPASIMAVLLILCLLASGTFSVWHTELASAIMLAVSSASFCFFISSLIKDPDTAGILTAFIFLAVTALCPVFFDIGAIVKFVKGAAMLLPPYHYLRLGGGILSAAVYSLVFFALGLLLRRLKKRE